MNKFRDYIYYILIGLISFVSIAFLPMLNSEIDVEYMFPKSTPAWILWIGTRVSVSFLNMVIFHCFVKQADENTKDDENRLKAEEILQSIRNKKEEDYTPDSPHRFLSKEYKKKIPMIILTTALSLISFSPALFAFDLVTFTTYLFTVVIAVVFGVMEMFKVEDYYKKDMLKYAKFKAAEDQRKQQEKEEQKLKQEAIEKEQKRKIKNYENLSICEYIGHKEN